MLCLENYANIRDNFYCIIANKPSLIINKTFWAQTGDVRLEVILEKGNTTTPVYYNRKSAEEFILISINEFIPIPPAPSAFDVPDVCKA